MIRMIARIFGTFVGTMVALVLMFVAMGWALDWIDHNAPNVGPVVALVGLILLAAVITVDIIFDD